MEYLTPKEIAKRANYNKSKINKLFLAQDDSHLWPINGKFNVTKRAIRKAQLVQKEYDQIIDGLEYALLLDNIISDLINKRCNYAKIFKITIKTANRTKK